MAMRRKRGRHRDGGQITDLSKRIASATKPEPSGGAEAQATSVLAPGLTRYQRQSANLPSGAKQMTVAELTNIVIDLRNEADNDSDDDKDGDE
ncbi:MAG: hypothetical protein QNL12_00730 [Acidimicrobiia bacterium]|nr:hypothetical protein [Acidimicrobiia bacterium]